MLDIIKCIPMNVIGKEKMAEWLYHSIKETLANEIVKKEINIELLLIILLIIYLIIKENNKKN